MHPKTIKEIKHETFYLEINPTAVVDPSIPLCLSTFLFLLSPNPSEY